MKRLMVVTILLLLAVPAAAQVADPAHAAWHRGEVDEAVRLYEQRLATDPTDILALHRVALAAAWNREFNRSLPLFDRLLDLDPGNVEARLHRANALAWSGRHREAESAFRDVLEQDPANVDARKGLARVSGWRGRLQESERQWRDLLGARPDDVDVLVGLAANLRWQGRTTAALDLVERAEALAPDHDDVAVQRQWLNAAVGPRVHPAFLYESDSDGNRTDTYRVTGNWLIAGRLGARLSADTRQFRMQDCVHDCPSTQSADLHLSLGLGSGWTVSGGGGVRTGRDPDQSTLGTWSAGLSSPGHLPVSAALSANRSVFDYTARLARTNVTVEELVLSLSSTAVANRLTLGARGGMARFQGTEDNSRWLAGTSATYRATRILSVGLNARGFGFSDQVGDGYWSPSFYGLVEAPVGLSVDRDGLFGGLELAPGYQTIDHPWIELNSGALRATGRVGYRFAPGRQLGVSAGLANSGLHRVSPVGEADYEYRAVSIFVDWSLR